MHVSFCTNYAVWEWVLENKRSRVPAGRVKTTTTEREIDDVKAKETKKRLLKLQNK
jgi:hypothetical protein